MKKRKRRFGLLAIFAVGAVGYSLLELLWRGYTHWTMAVTGGVCFSAIYALEKKLRRCELWLKCLAGTAVITAAEFLVGCVVNRGLGWGVWDYSARRGNLLGQICPLFSLIWFALCVVLFPLCALLRIRFETPQDGAALAEASPDSATEMVPELSQPAPGEAS